MERRWLKGRAVYFDDITYGSWNILASGINGPTVCSPNPITMQLGSKQDGMVSVSTTTSEHDHREEETEPQTDSKKSETSKTRAVTVPRFNNLPPPPPPSRFKRLALIISLFFLFWAGFKLRNALLFSNQPKVIHASR